MTLWRSALCLYFLSCYNVSCADMHLFFYLSWFAFLSLLLSLLILSFWKRVFLHFIMMFLFDMFMVLFVTAIWQSTSAHHNTSRSSPSRGKCTSRCDCSTRSHSKSCSPNVLCYTLCVWHTDWAMHLFVCNHIQWPFAWMYNQNNLNQIARSNALSYYYHTETCAHFLFNMRVY